MTTEKCRVCGAPLDRSSGDSLCPACMLRDVLATAGGEAQARAGAASQPLLPRRFGSYELLREIGRGGMGVVYAARQPALNRTVAVKLLLSGAHASETALRRFHTEAAAAAGLQHPNIVEIHDYGEVDGQPFYAMDLVEGQNLGELSAGRPLTAPRAAALLRQLARTVHYAHQHGILHRDLKPSNVLIDRDGRPRITDFGLARRLDDANGVTQTGEMLGSPSFIAPEQAAGRPQDIGVATDVYGLGALGYHLLTGRAPFNAATPSGTLRLVLEADPPPPRLLNPALPRDLETICLKCLAKDPARRYATAAEVGEDIERFLANRPIHARPPNVLYRARRFARRYRTGVIAVAAVFVALVAGLGVAVHGYRRAVLQQHAINAARARSQEMVNFIMQELQPWLRAHGRRDAMLATARTAVHYFDQLPPELRDHATTRAHAVALDQLGFIYFFDAIRTFDQYPAEAQEVAKQSLALWRQVAAQDPHDGEAAAAVVGRDFQVRAYGSPPAGGAELVALVKGAIAQYRKLEHQFPESSRVQFGLCRGLIQLAIILSYGPKPKAAIPLAAEARQRRERLHAKNPDDRQARYELALILGGSAIVYRNIGAFNTAAQLLEQGMTIVKGYLVEDPTNIQWLALGGTGALHLVWSLQSEQRKAEAARQLRSYTEVLVTLDPHDPEWLLRHAQALYYDALFCRADRRLANARNAIELSLARMETLSPNSFERAIRGDRLRLAGRIAAEEGDVAAARDRLEQLRKDFSGWPDQGRSAAETMKRRALLAYWHLDVVDALQSWPEVERHARHMLAQIDRSESALTIFRAAAQFYLGKALLKQGRARDAVPPLESAASYFRRAKSTAPFNDFAGPANCEVAETCGRAMLQAGDQTRAVGLLEWAFDKRDARVRAGGLLMSRIEAAQTAWLLAQALDTHDPAQAARRREVLARARELLDDPDTAPRLEPAERDLRTQIGAALGEDT